MHMAVIDLASALNELQSPSALHAQSAALKKLKNVAIGHSEIKQDLIRCGLVQALVTCLTNLSSSNSKKKGKDTNGNTGATSRTLTLSDDEEARLQAVILCGSLAHGEPAALDPLLTLTKMLGGPTFTSPLVKTPLVPLLVSSASPQNNPQRVVAAALVALSSLAKAFAEATFESCLWKSRPRLEDLSEQCYTPSAIQTWVQVLSQTSSSVSTQNQIIRVCQILKTTITSDTQRNALAQAGVLDLVGSRLAAYYVSQQFWAPRAVRSVRNALPAPPSRRDLCYVLEAINAITCKSRHRVARLLYSPVVASIFPLNASDVAAEAAFQTPVPPYHRQSLQFNLVDSYLPRMPTSTVRDAFSKQFPALGSAQSQTKYSALMDFAESVAHTPDRSSAPNASESTLISWLIYLVRNEQDINRLQAAKLLTTIARSGFFSPAKSRMLALLVVPVLTDMLREQIELVNYLSDNSRDEVKQSIIQEQVPKVLAELIHDIPLLQKAAVDCGADKKALALLKRTLTVPLLPRTPVWIPKNASSDNAMGGEHAVLGLHGIRPDVQHVMRCREASLILIAAVSEKEDEYRRTLTEGGVVTCIIESLSVIEGEPSEDLTDPSRAIENVGKQYGNPTPVILAACSAARSLSRSPALLRTSLIDNGLATPIAKLVHSRDINVMVAATDVVCNLILEFSPMREDLISGGIITDLCGFAHSNDSRLKLVSLWALKHLAHKAPNEVRLTAFRELGTAFVTQLITGNLPSSTAKGARPSGPSMSAANSAGERVEILNVTEDAPMAEASESPIFPGTPTGHTPNQKEVLIPQIFSHIPELIPLAEQHSPRLREIKDLDDAAPGQKAARDELQIQVQGLDFIRNMLQGPKTAEMIDTLFKHIGQVQLFDVISSKIQPSSFSPSTLAAAAATATASSPTSFMAQSAPDPMFTQPSEIIASTLYILVHICAGAPRHRTMVVTSRPMMSAVLACLSHYSGEVKIPALLSLINLTWIDDGGDIGRVKEACKLLRGMGFAEALDRLRNDVVLNVRERAGSAFNMLLAGEQGLRSSTASREVSGLSGPPLGGGVGSSAFMSSHSRR